MNRKSGSGSGIFLMEMIVAVFFFMLCASTCILAFAKSDKMSRLASERNHAVSAAQSVAEIWKIEGAEGLAERMYACRIPEGPTTGDGNVTKDGGYRIYWDGDWQPVDASAETAQPDHRYTAELFESGDGDGMMNLQIHVLEDGDHGQELFGLEVSRYDRRTYGES